MEHLERAIPKNERERVSAANLASESVRRLPEVTHVEHNHFAFGFDQTDPGRFRDFMTMRPELLARIVDVGMRCTKFLNAPLILDSFADHDARRSWRTGLTAQERSYIESNKMRANVIHPVTMGFAFLSAELKKEGEQPREDVRQLLEICASVPKFQDYHFLSNDEKMDLVKRLDALCRRYMEYITGTDQTSTVH